MNSGIWILRVLLPLTDRKRRFTASSVRVVRFQKRRVLRTAYFLRKDLYENS